MKLIKPYFEIIEQQPGEVGMLKHIEAQGRTAWKSEDRITEDSYIKFIDMLKGVNHGSVLEHGTVYLKYNHNSLHPYEGSNLYEKYKNNKYSECHYDYINRDTKATIITTNYRVLFDNNWLDDLKYQCEPTEFHEKRITVKFVCDRGVSHEFVRHRVFSFTQESTRYCNYSNDKFGNEITLIMPCWFKNEHVFDSEEVWNETMQVIENNYNFMINNGWKPQQARAILPNSLKTELIMTGFVSDWKHFFMLRTASGAHPQAQELAIPLQEKFKELNLI